MGPTRVEVEEIKAIVEAMGNAAFRAVMAGFDAVEIHGHTGYLLDQFMTAEWNHRTDEYGGDLDGRLRFAIEIVQEIRRRVGPDFPILFRLAAVHNFPNGRTVEESAEIARKLEAAGIDAIHLDAGSYESMDWIFPPTYLGDAPLLDEIAYVKERVGIPVIGVGNMTPEIAEETIGAGKADFIAIGRGLLADPELPDKLRLGKRDEIRPCIRCNEYCIGRVFALRTMSCAVNPQAGNERFYPSVPARTSKRVLVIGGGPGGLEAARVAAERGHQVTLVEKEPVLGGILTAAATPPFKKCLRSMVDWWDAQLKHLGVDVRTGVTATAQLAEIADADAVIVATGGKPILPDIPGIDGENVVEVIDAHLKRKPVGQNVVVAGGGLSGCDAALELAMQGKSVTIVEMLDGLANDMIVISRISLLSKLAEYNVKTLTGHRVKQFLPDGLLAVMEDGKEVKVTADTSVVAFGMRSDLQLAREIEAVHDHVYAIGDCQHPAKVGDAIHAGFQAAYLQ